jgi:uncharacterized protein
MEKFGLIVTLAQRIQGKNSRFGKTALQKLVYLAQETQGVPSGYQFTFYNHGPFSSELAGDLSYLDSLGVVNVSYVDNGWGGFIIKAGPEAEETLDHAKEFVGPNNVSINRVVSDFGTMTAKELELSATIVFVASDFRRRGHDVNGDALVTQVHDLKPQFSEREISAAIQELKAKGYIQISAMGVTG